jgi:hypothetical protein
MMIPLQPDPNWFEKYWYSEASARPLWRVRVALATMAAVMVAGLFT